MTTRRRRPATLLAAAAAAVLVASLGACGSGSKSGSGGDKNAPDSLTIGYIPAVTAGGVPAIAQRKGLFEKAGLKVKFVSFTSGPAQAAAMAGGSLDIEYLGGPAIWEAARGGGKIIALSDISFDAFLLAQPDAGIRTIGDLKGKKVGVTQGNSSEFIFQAALDSANVDRKSVSVVNVDPTAAVSAFAGKQIQAVATFLPFSAAIRKRIPNAVTIARSRDFPEYALPGVYVASNDLLAKNRPAIGKFLRVAAEARDIRARDRATAVDATAAFTDTPADALSEQYDAEQWLTPRQILDWYGTGKFDALLKKIQKIMVEIGALDEVVPPEKFTDLGQDKSALTSFLRGQASGG